MVVVMFGVAGTGYNVVRRLAEDGKVSITNLTSSFRGRQSSFPLPAPLLEYDILMALLFLLTL